MFCFYSLCWMRPSPPLHSIKPSLPSPPPPVGARALWQELPRETKVALGRLDAIFDTEKVLTTNMTLPTQFVLAVSNRIDELGITAPSLSDSRSLSRTAKSSPRYVYACPYLITSRGEGGGRGRGGGGGGGKL